MYTTAGRGEQDPFLRDVLRTVRKRAWVILLTAVVFAGVAVGVSYLQTPSYEASARMLVGQTEDSERTSSLGSDIMGLQQATLTVAEAVNSVPVARDVARQLDLRTDPNGLLANLEVEQVRSTQFIQLTYTDSDPGRAQEIVNAFMYVASKRVADSSAGASGIETSPWQFAQLPEAPVEPNPMRNGVLALALGLMLGVGLTFLLEYLDDGWRSPEEVERVLPVPSFGTVPPFDTAKIKRMRSA